MRVFLTLVTVVLVTLTSCQKDYYLEDLNNANEQIALLERVAQARQITINELNNKIDIDKQTIAQLNGEINSAYATIETLEQLSAVQLAQLEITQDELATVKAQLEESIGLVADLTDELNELSALKDSLIAELNASTEENADLNNRVDDLTAAVSSLEADLEAEKQNIKTIVFDNTDYTTIAQLQTTIMNLEQEINGLNNVIDEQYGDMALVPTTAPNNKPNGSFFTIGVDGVVVQVYGHAGAERHVPFTVDAEGNNAQPIGGDAQLYRINRDDLEGAPYSIERAIYLANNVERYNG